MKGIRVFILEFVVMQHCAVTYADLCDAIAEIGLAAVTYMAFQ